MRQKKKPMEKHASLVVDRPPCARVQPMELEPMELEPMVQPMELEPMELEAPSAVPPVDPEVVVRDQPDAAGGTLP